MRVAGLVLAAGEGRRFGGPKAVATLEGERLVDRAVRSLTEAGCSPVLVVSGAVDLEVPGARVISNPLWRTGMGSSLRAGLDGLARYREADGGEVDSAVVLLVDTPWLTAGAVRRLVELGSAAPAAIATYDGRRGHPVLLSAPIWSAVAELAVADTAARGRPPANPH